MQDSHHSGLRANLKGFLLGVCSLGLLTAAWTAPGPALSLSGSSSTASGSESSSGSGSVLGDVLGPVSCAECHVEEFDVWKSSHHESGSRSLTRSKEAKLIAKKLGVRRIKSEERCASCHYTLVPKGESSKAVSGVSCESCHGPAGGWVELHQEFGSVGTTIEQETSEHRDQRSAACDDVGMVRPDRVHQMAARCFTCHVIDDEELVDVAGHPSGEEFELVAWSQGEMRHNFLRGGGQVNADAPLARRRMMFIAGRMLDLKYSLMALSEAKGGGGFEAMTIKRIRRSLASLKEIKARIDISEVDAVLDKCEGLSLSAGLKIDEAIQRIDHCSAKLEARADGSEFAALDELLPSQESYVGASKE